MAEVQAYDGVFECCSIGNIVEVPLYTLKIRCVKFITCADNLTIEEVERIINKYNDKALFFSIHRQ